MTSRKRVTVAPVITTLDLARIMSRLWNQDGIDGATLDTLASAIERERVVDFRAFYEQTWEDVINAAEVERLEAEELEKR